MGANQSLEPYHAPLVPQDEPICIIGSNYCLKQSIQLRIRERIGSIDGDEFKIMDPSTGEVKFQISGKPFTLGHKKTLFGPCGEPLVNVKRRLSCLEEEYKLYTKNNSICRVHAEPNIMIYKIWLDVKDKDIPGKKHKIVLKSDCGAKSAVIYLGEPKNGGVPIAKIFRPFTVRSLFGFDEYILEVVAGVDVVLMIMLCVVFDAHIKDSGFKSF